MAHNGCWPPNRNLKESFCSAPLTNNEVSLLPSLALRQTYVCPSTGPWTLSRVSPAVLNIHGDFQPNTEYRISVVADDTIRDGFGLPLLGNDVTKWSEPLQPFLSGPLDFTLFSPVQSSPDLQFLLRGRRPGPPEKYVPSCDALVLKAKPVTVSGVADALNTLYFGCQDSDRYFRDRSVVTVGPAPTADDVMHTITVPGERLYEPSGVYLQRETQVQGPWQERCRPHSYHHCRLFARASFGVSTVTAPGQVTVWVTALLTAQGLADAEVEVYEVPDDYRRSNRVVRRERATTDRTGLAVVATALTGRVQVVVTHSGQLSFTELYIPHPAVPGLIYGDLLTDRTLYRAGEEVHIKGYVQRYNADGVLQRLAEYPGAARLDLEVDFGSDSDRVVVPVAVDPTFGSFDGTVPIPSDVKYGHKSVSLRASGPRDHEYWHIDTASFTIADPRVPTGVLELSTPTRIYRPRDSAVPLRIVTKTYTGTVAKGTQVTLRWRVGEHSGESTVRVPEGTVEYPFRCADSIVRSAAEKRQDLSISVEWLTASRDLLRQSVTVRVAKSLWEGTLSVPAGAKDVLPGFPAKAELRLVIAKPTAVSPAKPPTVAMRVARHTSASDAEAYAQAAAAAVGDVQFRWDAESARDGDTLVTAVATFTIPTMGEYRIVARYVDENRVAQYAAVVVGRTEAQWRRRPLVDWRPVQALEVVGQDYAAGEQVTLRWVSPFPAAQVLVQWGGGYTAPRHVLLPLTQGPNLLNFTLGSECLRGCDAVASVVTPAQTPVALPVPVSQMLDTTLPQHIDLGAVAIPVAVPKRTVPVAVQVPAEVAPGATADIALTLPLEDGAQGEVAVWVVDKALLDLQPNPLPTTLKVQQLPSVHSDLSGQSTYDQLTSAETLRKALNLTRERLLQDPWVYQGSWQPHPGSQLDTDTASYLECIYGQMTHFPTPGEGYSDPCLPVPRGEPMFMADGVEEMAMDAAAPGAAPPRAAMLKSGLERATANTIAAPVAAEAEAYGTAMGGAAAASAAPAVLLRSDFKATAMFVGKAAADAQGRVRVSFNVPDNIGTWVVRAVAVVAEKDGVTRRFGNAEAKVVARRPVSLLASMPRVVRVGDTFRAGCTVTAVRDGPVTLHARFDGPSALRFVGPTQKSVTLRAHAPQEIVFELQSIALGAATVQYMAVQVFPPQETPRFLSFPPSRPPFLLLPHPTVLEDSFQCRVV